MSTEILFEKKDHIAIITLNRSPLNIFDSEYYRILGETFEAAGGMEDVFVIIFTANGKMFSAGNNIKEFVNFKDVGEIADQQVHTKACMHSIYSCKKPVICAVQGSVVGAGLAAVGCCDLVVAAEDIFFSLPEVKVGTLGGANYLKTMLPDKIARYYAYTGKPISAQEMLAHGGINRIAPKEELMNVAFEIAEEILANAPGAVQMIKENIIINDDAKLVEKYSRELTTAQPYMFTEDSKEARAAFFEKRKGIYKNK